MSSGSVVSLSSFNLLFITQVLTVLTSTVKYNEYITDKGKNISLPCDANGTIMWVKEGVSNTTVIQTGTFLILKNVSESDGGIYVCFASMPAVMFAATETSSSTERISEDDKLGEEEESSNNNHNSHINTLLSNRTLLATETAETATTTINAKSAHKKTHSTLTTSLPKPAIPQPTSGLTDFVPLTALANSSNSSSFSSNNNSATIHPLDKEFVPFQRLNLTVRTPPGPVSQLYFKASTILGFLIWRCDKTMSGGYPVRSFTAEFRNVSYREAPYNSTFEHEWSRMDPINIAPNVCDYFESFSLYFEFGYPQRRQQQQRQMEVYHLEPNTTYEFRIWANNQLGSGAVVTTNVTTLPETKEEDLIRLIQPDLDNFDPRIWIVAVSIVLGTLVILGIGLCIVLSKECYQASHKGYEDGWDSIELIPNIILNPGFCESDGPDMPYTRTIIFGEDDDSDGYESEESDHEPRLEKFKRKVSIFFTGPTIKRI